MVCCCKGCCAGGTKAERRAKLHKDEQARIAREGLELMEQRKVTAVGVAGDEGIGRAEEGRGGEVPEAPPPKYTP